MATLTKTEQLLLDRAAQCGGRGGISTLYGRGPYGGRVSGGLRGRNREERRSQCDRSDQCEDVSSHVGFSLVWLFEGDPSMDGAAQAALSTLTREGGVSPDTCGIPECESGRHPVIRERLGRLSCRGFRLLARLMPSCGRLLRWPWTPPSPRVTDTWRPRPCAGAQVGHA